MLCYALFAFSLNEITFKMEIRVMPLERGWSLSIFEEKKYCLNSVSLLDQNGAYLNL